MKKHIIINISILLGFVAALFLSMSGFSNSCDEMYDNIIRIRVIANSNSDTDQSLKLIVRDLVLENSKCMLSEECTYDDALCVIDENLDSLVDSVKKSLLNLGYKDAIKAEIRDEFFETRAYDGFSLPAGEYKTLVFTVGDGKGENWWCVVFPQVCLGSCSGSLTDTLSAESALYAYSADKYVMKFKTVEIFEKFKKYLEN